MIAPQTDLFGVPVRRVYSNTKTAINQRKRKEIEAAIRGVPIKRKPGKTADELRQWKIEYKREARRKAAEKAGRQFKAASIHQAHVLAWMAWKEKATKRAQSPCNAHVQAWKTANQAAWFRHRYRNDPEFNAKQKMRARLRKATEPDSEVARLLANYTKGNKWKQGWADLLGYGLDELVAHLRKTVPKRCSWDDFLTGKLHIDHIIPRSSFDMTQASELRACWALPNLRLLRAKDNLRKAAKVETML